MEGDDTFIRIPQLARLLGISVTSAFRLVKGLKLPVIRASFGGKTWSSVEVSAFLRRFDRGEEGQKDVVC